MAIPVNKALSALAKLQKSAEGAKRRAMQEKESAAERADYLLHSGVRFGAAAAAGAADALVDDTMAGLTPAELGGALLGALSLAGVLGKGTKLARSGAEGALCYAVGRRAYAMAKDGIPVLSGGVIGASHEDDLIAAMRAEVETEYDDAEDLID